jgi:multidrug efflux pump subunit AcrA (membrane-fusion protein)
LTPAASLPGRRAYRGDPAARIRAADSIVKPSGRVEGREVTIAPKDIQGRVRRLLADEGQTVKSACGSAMPVRV